MSQDFGGMGRQYLQQESYGVSAFCFYRAVIEDSMNANAWNGLVLSLSLMMKEYDSQVILARFALQQQLTYDKDMVSFAMMMYQQNPLALSQWIRAMSTRFGASSQERQAFAQMADEMKGAYNGLVDTHGEEMLKNQGMLSLEELAERRIELDWIHSEPLEQTFALVQARLEDPETVLSGVRLLCMLPDPRSERLLRRVSRSEQVDGKVRTHALLALRWLGVRGNAKIEQMGESHVINLDDPQPELSISVPSSFRPALDRMKLWLAKQQGIVSEEEYEQHAATDEPNLPKQLAQKLENADIPSALQEVVHALIRSAYHQYYPLVPNMRGARQWSIALLLLMKEYAEGVGESWPYGEPQHDETAVLHRNWIVSATPDFRSSIEAAGKLRADQSQ